MSIEALAPLIGSWRGTVSICFPGSDEFGMTHTEQVRRLGDRSMITIEGNSYADPSPGSSATPEFSALAVVFDGDDLDRANQLHWHAFRDGHALQTVADIETGRYCWSAPGPAGPIRYTAEFGASSWREWGILAGDDGTEEVFVMELHRPD